MVEVTDLISSGRVFHKVLPLYFMDLWPIELANKCTCKLSLYVYYKNETYNFQ